MNITIKTTRAATPTIYAYTTPGVVYHEGWTKIGYTERDAQTRIKEQTRTAGIRFNLEWTGEAIFDGEPRKVFSDRDFHAYLRKLDVKREDDSEWFEVTGAASQKYFREFKGNRGVLKKFSSLPYKLREEQARAVETTLEYFNRHADGEFLWNAKPRFGKTLATYDLCKRTKAQNVLIVTNRPAIANSWYDDYVKFFGGGDWLFVSEVDALKGKPYVLSRADYINEALNHDAPKCIEFVSLQDLKGSVYFGGEIKKLAEVADMNWDILIVDEAHEGVDTYKTDVAFDRIKRRFTLHLSGTPFKALANNKFTQAAIFNWTYSDEQEKKFSWNDVDEENPYAELPRLNLYTYQMSEIVRDEIKRGVEIDGASAEYAFDLNEFFKVEGGKFVYDSSVNKFLDALTVGKKFPFSTPELRDELRHTFWLLNRVESARALAAKLKAHPTFGTYEIILAAGDGKINDDDENKKSYDKVVTAIKNHERTITLSVGQLTTGVTVPEWTGVLMLANMHSPALYIQAAFRAQNPCLFQRGEKFLRKENSYVFDFDPARTLTIFEAFANDLSPNRGDLITRQENIRKLLNFFPVIGEDERGELIELDAEKVLSIPRRIRAVEVVERGFMSDFLFQNISHVFNASAEVIEIISNFPAVKEVNLPEEIQTAAEKLFIDDDGEISLPKDYVIGQAAEIFGEKIFTDVEPTAKAATNFLRENNKALLDTAQENYGGELKASERGKLERQLNAAAKTLVEKTFKNRDIDKRIIEDERGKALKKREESGRTVEEINAEFDSRQKAAEENFQAELIEKINDFSQKASENIVEHVEEKIQEREKNSVEDDIRDHLRGFSRTIPSFLMAYGDETVTLANFDKIIPDKVFRELTSISLEDFRYLRDEGNLFDEVTFDDAVKEFMRLRRELADYFDEAHDEDIFDYIPPQKTNQIFTPKETVIKMVDLVEAENPGCFDSPDKKFIDLYMKSGLFAAEIVKRLYRSERLKELFPDKATRLRHIFAEQIFGLAPTEIIFRIATNYILGFGITVEKNNFRQVDALTAAKDDTLSELLEKLYD